MNVGTFHIGQHYDILWYRHSVQSNTRHGWRTSRFKTRYVKEVEIISQLWLPGSRSVVRTESTLH